MTINTISNKIHHGGNGATTVFSYDFEIPDEDSVTITLTDSTGTETVLIAGQFSISGVGNPAGGNVTYPVSGSPLASGWIITIERSVAYTQPTDIENQDGFYPEAIEEALDRLTMLTQQLRDVLVRTVRAPLIETEIGPLPPVDNRASSFMGFDATGQPIAIAGSVSAASVSAAMAPVIAAATLSLARAAMGIASFAAGGAVSNGTVLGNFSGASAPPSFSTLQSMLDLVFGSTVGSIIYRASGSGWQSLSPGTNGHVLTTQGAGLAPIWSTNSIPYNQYEGLVITSSTVTTLTLSVTMFSGFDGTNPKVFSSISAQTLNIATTGANALDTGTVAADTWYYIWLIGKSDGTRAGLMSVADTTPTMPSGYTFKVLVGAVRTDGSAQIIPTTQYDRTVQYLLPRQMISGINGNPATPTWTAVALGNYIPLSIAREVELHLFINGNGVAAAGPNNSMGSATTYNTNPPRLVAGYGSTGINIGERAWMLRESNDMYFASQLANSALNIIGWRNYR